MTLRLRPKDEYFRKKRDMEWQSGTALQTAMGRASYTVPKFHEL